MPAAMSIAGRRVGPGSPCFVIAEAGVNHNGDLDRARKMIDVAADCGADAIKFQTFSADRLASPSAPKAEYQVATTGAAGSQHAMLKSLELSAADHRDLQAHCRERGILFLSTPFDEESADFLASLDVPAFKISSGDLTNHPLILHACGKGRPVILSTGMASLDEVSSAAAVARGAGADFALLQCVSNYPADPADVNLRVMQTYSEKFGVPVGYSDHTLGIAVPIAAVALGAAILEKHFTLDRALPGPDHAASLEPAELKAMMQAIRVAESAMGDGIKRPSPSELPVRDIGRKSLHWRRDMAAGDVASAGDFIALRPGTGIPPACQSEFAGRVLAVAARAGALVLPGEFRR